MPTAEELADRICEVIDVAKAADAARQNSHDGTGRPLLLYPIQPGTRVIVGAMISNWHDGQTRQRHTQQETPHMDFVLIVAFGKLRKAMPRVVKGGSQQALDLTGINEEYRSSIETDIKAVVDKWKAASDSKHGISATTSSTSSTSSSKS